MTWDWFLKFMLVVIFIWVLVIRIHVIKISEKVSQCVEVKELQ